MAPKRKSKGKAAKAGKDSKKQKVEETETSNITKWAPESFLPPPQDEDITDGPHLNEKQGASALKPGGGKTTPPGFTTESTRPAINALLPYLALGFVPQVTLGGDRGKCGCYALLQSVRAVYNLFGIRLQPGFALTVENLEAMLRSEALKKVGRDIMETQSYAPNIIEDEIEANTHENYYNATQLSWLLTLLNRRTLPPTHFDLGIITAGDQNSPASVVVLGQGDNAVIWIWNNNRSDEYAHWQSLGPLGYATGVRERNRWGLADEVAAALDAGVFVMRARRGNLRPHTFVYQLPEDAQGPSISVTSKRDHADPSSIDVTDVDKRLIPKDYLLKVHAGSLESFGEPPADVDASSNDEEDPGVEQPDPETNPAPNAEPGQAPETEVDNDTQQSDESCRMFWVNYPPEVSEKDRQYPNATPHLFIEEEYEEDNGDANDADDNVNDLCGEEKANVKIKSCRLRTAGEVEWSCDPQYLQEITNPFGGHIGTAQPLSFNPQEKYNYPYLDLVRELKIRDCDSKPEDVKTALKEYRCVDALELHRQETGDDRYRAQALLNTIDIQTPDTEPVVFYSIQEDQRRKVLGDDRLLSETQNGVVLAAQRLEDGTCLVRTINALTLQVHEKYLDEEPLNWGLRWYSDAIEVHETDDSGYGSEPANKKQKTKK